MRLTDILRGLFPPGHEQISATESTQPGYLRPVRDIRSRVVSVPHLFDQDIVAALAFGFEGLLILERFRLEGLGCRFTQIFRFLGDVFVKMRPPCCRAA